MKIDGVKIFDMPTAFSDHRGNYHELFNRQALVKAGIEADFLQFSVSTSNRGVLRGIHGDEGTAKLIGCLFGEIQYAFVDNRETSNTYFQVEHGKLSGDSTTLIYLPPGIGNAYLTLSEVSVYMYAQTTYYGEFEQFTLPWDDPKFAIPWEIAKPILSQRDGG